VGGCIQRVFNNFLGKNCVHFLVTLDPFPLEKNEYKLNTTPFPLSFLYTIYYFLHVSIW
jgi:hypothetical protein